MTDTVKGAGRRRAAAKTSKVARNEQRLAELKRDQETGKAPARGKASAAKRTRSAVEEAVKPAPPAPAGDWDAAATLGSNVDRLKTGGATWKAISEMARANGHDIPWPDGGKLLRARKQFLAGTEGKVPERRRRTSGVRSHAPRADGQPDETEGMSYEEAAAWRTKRALETRSVPWDDESTDEEVLAFLNGRRITYVFPPSGKEMQFSVLRDHPYNKIKEGKDGRYVEFCTTEGPFHAVSLSRIIHVS